LSKAINRRVELVRIQSDFAGEEGPLAWARVRVLQIEHVLDKQDGACSEEEQGYVPMGMSNNHRSILHPYHLLCLNGLAGRLVKRCFDEQR
jgi:hypothetical protein